MAPNFQSSFIPKESPTANTFAKKDRSLAGMLAVTLFVLSLIGSAGIYFYKGMVRNDISALKAQLSESEKNIDKETIDEMLVFSKKLEVIKEIVYKHRAVSNVLAIIASSTVSTVYFDDFNYSTSPNGGLSVVLHGKALGYAAVALEESILSQEKYFKSTNFANLALSEGGLVSFDLTISVDPEAAVYSKEEVPATLTTPITGSDEEGMKVDDLDLGSDLEIPDL